MNPQVLYKECPLCTEAPVALQNNGVYACTRCGLTIKERSVLGLFKKGQYGVVQLGAGDFLLGADALKNLALSADELKNVLGNLYTADQLAQLAAGQLEVLRPVRTVLAQIILEQLKEDCYVNIHGVRRGYGAPLPEQSFYLPQQPAPMQGMQWQDEGNLFCTNQRLVLPSNQFTFIKLGRKISAVQAFTNGVAVQQKDEAFATYFIGCQAHEAALAAAYIMAKVPLLRPASS